jgi:hypothetical protein
MIYTARRRRAMPSFYPYHPEQAYPLPPSVREVLSEKHLCFFVSRAVEQLDLSTFEQAYGDVAIEFTLAALAYNLTGMWRQGVSA